MDSLSNFSDVMLVLAVGIMLALILRWNLPIGQPSRDMEGDGSESGTVSLDRNDLHAIDQIPDAASEIGSVYFDPQTGSYYIMTE